MITPARLVRDWRSIGLAVLATLCFGSASASAATLNVVGGQLYGASGVIVDGSLYDVQFLDGTCIALHNGCDEVSDFTFQTSGAAELAANALLDQVFLDSVLGNFDSDPGNLISSCAPSSLCAAFTIFGIENANTMLLWSSVNYGHESLDQVGSGSAPSSYDTSGLEGEGLTYAVWSLAVVPEPNTALLLSLGLTGLAAKRRRSLRS